MRQAERYHRYPKPLTASVAWLSALVVAVAMINLGATLLHGLWDVFDPDETVRNRFSFLSLIVGWVQSLARPDVTTVSEMLPILLGPLIWAAVALLVALVLRNAFPAVRTSSVGLLVEFAGGWLPLCWEDLRDLKVTQDTAGERFVLIAETDRHRLTTWHRLYSFCYGFSGRRGFFITSNISEFEDLLTTMLAQSERTARAIEGAVAIRLREDAPSLLFRLLLSPSALFSRTASASNEQAVAPVSQPVDGPVRAIYPARISVILAALTAVLVLSFLVNYLGAWSQFLALTFPALRSQWPFSMSLTNPAPAPWWLLTVAHLRLLVAVPGILWLRDLLPGLQSREDGLAVRGSLLGRWHLVPWQQVRAFKATEISEVSQVLLLQSPRLPSLRRLSSMLYDGSAMPGVIITSAMSNFPDLLSHTVNHIAPLEQEGQPPILQQEARSWLAALAFQRQTAFEALVSEAREDLDTKDFAVRRWLADAGPFVLIALLPALLVLANGLLGQHPPTLGLLGAFLGFWICGLIEWPLVSLLSFLLDKNTGGGEEGYRAVGLYPHSQLPRLLPLLLALLFQVVGLPILPLLAWGAAIAWAYWLTANLVTTLYEWQGSQTILGGLFPVFWQLLLLIGFLVVTR